MRVKFKPDYNECCSCTDDQITFSRLYDCNKCKMEHTSLLVGFVAKKKITFAIIQYGGKLKEYPISEIEVLEDKE